MSPIKEAIEALESSVRRDEEDAPWRTTVYSYAMADIRAALAALRSMPAEPVLMKQPLFVFANEVIMGAWKPEELPEQAHRAMSAHRRMLTTPPPAPVLSDAEIDAITVAQWGDRVVTAAYRAYARAILGRASRGAK